METKRAFITCMLPKYENIINAYLFYAIVIQEILIDAGSQPTSRNEKLLLGRLKY